MKGYFKGKDIDEVLKALKEANKKINAVQLQKECLKNWEILKVEAIFEYLCENKKYNYKFKSYGYDDVAGYVLEYDANDWDNILEQGGFERHWKERENMLQKIKGTLTECNVPFDTTIKIFDLIKSLF